MKKNDTNKKDGIESMVASSDTEKENDVTKHTSTEINPKEVEAIIDKLPEREKKVVQELIMESRYSGPLPPPDYFAGYKNVLESAPERILTMAEKEQAHRHDMDSRIVESNRILNNRGQTFGLILVIVFGLIGLCLGLSNCESLAKTIFTTTILGVAVVFVLHQIPFSKKNVKEDSADKNK